MIELLTHIALRIDVTPSFRDWIHWGRTGSICGRGHHFERFSKQEHCSVVWGSHRCFEALCRTGVHGQVRLENVCLWQNSGECTTSWACSCRCDQGYPRTLVSLVTLLSHDGHWKVRNPVAEHDKGRLARLQPAGGWRDVIPLGERFYSQRSRCQKLHVGINHFHGEAVGPSHSTTICLLAVSPPTSWNLTTMGTTKQKKKKLWSEVFHHYLCVTSFCRVNSAHEVKIADFGLSRDLHRKDYYKMAELHNKPMPIKWMAAESLNLGKFTVKSDVVSWNRLDAN